MSRTFLLLTILGTATLQPLASGCAGQPAAPPPTVSGRVLIAVTEHGFEPAAIAIRKGDHLILVFTRTTSKSCLKEVVVYTTDHEHIRRALPLGEAVEIPVVFDKTGELGYACGMSMYGGTIQVK